ncbi:MAG: response regulator [Nostocales cyanobacterium 94392]|nr:response regulator [Nostocales cyanobacterium 94392]
MILVLVVDDEVDVQLLFKQQFRKEIKAKQVKFHFAFSGEEAINYLQTEDMASLVLILSDINMPGMNGLELLKIIKNEYPHLKVFMITAYGDDKNHQTAIAYGADDYINKPIEFSNLKTKVLSFVK